MLVLFPKKKRKNMPIILALKKPQIFMEDIEPNPLFSPPPTPPHMEACTYTQKEKGEQRNICEQLPEKLHASAIAHHGYTYTLRSSNRRSNLCSNLSLNHTSFSTLIHPPLKYICPAHAEGSFGRICNTLESTIHKITWLCIKKLKSLM